ncbi:MAG: hypothetical protein JWO78_2023 [Micavibrio sp.]|nr:hypothetical protein [Micavibrio sp.]
MRLPLLSPKGLSDDQKPLYNDMKAGIEGHFKGFRTIDESGELMGPWNPMLHYPQFGGPVWDLIKAISFSPTLPKPVREIAILVTGARYHAAYELYAHVRVADLVGLSDEKIATISAGQRPQDLSEDESVAYDVAAALNSGGTLPEPTYKAAIDAFGEDGAAELVYLVGVYAAVSVILNGFDVPVPEPAG